MRTSNSLPDAAIGRITHGTRLLREGGFEGVYKQTFGEFQPNENLKKTYACHLSTSNGAVGGTLYITNLKFAFCSDRELTYYPTPGQSASSYYKVCTIFLFSAIALVFKVHTFEFKFQFPVEFEEGFIHDQDLYDCKATILIFWVFLKSLYESNQLNTLGMNVSSGYPSSGQSKGGYPHC